MLRRMLPILIALPLLVPAAVRAQTSPRLADHFFDAKGVKIRYVEAGSGTPVVLVHGFSSSLDLNWVRTGVFNELAKQFRVIAFDCRGHGQSDKPHDVASYGNEMVEDIARLLDHLRITKAHIVGYSMGGAITGKFVTVHPDRVLTAVFGGSAPRLGATAQAERDAEELATSLEQGKGMRPLIVRLAPPGEKPSEADIEQRSRDALGRNDPLALAAVTRGNRQQQVTLAQVSALKMPVLAVIGSADPIKAGVDAFKKVLPSLTMVVIEGATHSGARGAPGRPEFVAAVRDFLVSGGAAASQ